MARIAIMEFFASDANRLQSYGITIDGELDLSGKLVHSAGSGAGPTMRVRASAQRSRMTAAAPIDLAAPGGKIVFSLRARAFAECRDSSLRSVSAGGATPSIPVTFGYQPSARNHSQPLRLSALRSAEVEVARRP